jgi:hypothetical protein
MVAIRRGQTLLRLTVRFPNESLDDFASAIMKIMRPDGTAVDRAAEIDLEASEVFYQITTSDLPLLVGIYAYLAVLTDGTGRVAKARHVGRFQVVEEFAT